MRPASSAHEEQTQSANCIFASQGARAARYGLGQPVDLAGPRGEAGVLEARVPPSPATQAISRLLKAGETVCQTLFCTLE